MFRATCFFAGGCDFPGVYLRRYFFTSGSEPFLEPFVESRVEDAWFVFNWFPTEIAAKSYVGDERRRVGKAPQSKCARPNRPRKKCKRNRKKKPRPAMWFFFCFLLFRLVCGRFGDPEKEREREREYLPDGRETVVGPVPVSRPNVSPVINRPAGARTE